MTPKPPTTYTGNAIQKSQHKEAMRDLALIVSGGIKAYGLANSDILLVKKYSITKSDITLARDTDALYACERIATYANGNSSALEAFGVAASTLTDLMLQLADGTREARSFAWPQ